MESFQSHAYWPQISINPFQAIFQSFLKETVKEREKKKKGFNKPKSNDHYKMKK